MDRISPALSFRRRPSQSSLWYALQGLILPVELFSFNLNKTPTPLLEAGAPVVDLLKNHLDPMLKEPESKVSKKPAKKKVEETEKPADPAARDKAERLFRSASVYEDGKAQSSFTVAEIQRLVDCLFLDLSQETLQTDLSDRADKDKKKTQTACALKADGNAFKFLESTSGANIQFLDMWLRLVKPIRPTGKTSKSSVSNYASGNNSPSHSPSPITDLHQFKFEVFEALCVPVLSNDTHATDLTRIRHKEDFLHREMQDLARWTEETHTLVAALQKVEDMLEKRYVVQQELIDLAHEEASAFLALLPVFTRKDGMQEVGQELIETAKAKAENTLAFSKKWALLQLEIDRIDKVSSEYRVKLGQAAITKSEWNQKAAALDVELAQALKKIFDPYTSFMDKSLLMQEAHKKDQDELEHELAAHRKSILNLSEQSLNALDILIAISEQFLASGFVVDPKHFVNYAHSILRKGEVGFDSFQHAAEVRNLVSAHAASEIADERDKPWSTIVLGRVQVCRKAAELSKKHLVEQLTHEWKTDKTLLEHGNAVAQHTYDRAVAVLDFKEKSVSLSTQERRVALAELHLKSTELIMKRDQSIQAFHKRRDFLEYGHSFA